MEISETPATKKEDRCALRKKAKRFEQSRDNIKAKNREKAATIKKLSDRLTELKSSRDHWRAQSSLAAKECRAQKDELRRATKEVEALKEGYNQLQQEVDNFKKKRKTRLFW